MDPVNLISDTQTRPTPAMRRAMAEAEVGDEQRFADPTVNRLCERVAELLGFEAAVFLPSGTMCNEIAIRLHIRPGGDELLLHRTAHPRRFEAGGPAVLSGAVLHPPDGPRGMFDAETLASALGDPGYRYGPRSRMVSIEQTTNIAGGHVWPLRQVRAIAGVARENGLRLHMDGARLMNAVVAAGVPAAEWCRGFDSAWIARALAEGLATLPGVDLDPAAVETNMVIFGVADAGAFCERLAAAGTLMGPVDARTVRAVTHLDVDAAGVRRALDAARTVLAG